MNENTVWPVVVHTTLMFLKDDVLNLVELKLKSRVRFKVAPWHGTLFQQVLCNARMWRFGFSNRVFCENLAR